jgi:type IV pilus assembly protein PilQ
MTHRVCFRKTVLWFAVLLFANIFMLGKMNGAISVQHAFAAPGQYQVTGIKTDNAADGVMLRVTGSAPPTFTMYELFEPQRVILDIADGSFAQAINFPVIPGSGPVTRITGSVLDDKKPLIARLEMLTDGDTSYTVQRDANDIVIHVKQKGTVASGAKEPETEPPAIVASAKKAPIATSMQVDAVEETAAGEIETTETVEVETVESVEEPAAETIERPAPPAAASSESVSIPARMPAAPAPMLDELNAAGYTKPPITIDFYKIDLHNVFRLFGEISGMNIVIAQGVGGTLTLALDNVPWDFVLDVVLNLQNLQAIERYNTLVIAPKGREFEWPEREADKVSVKKDEAILQESENLQVVQKMELSPEVLEAQKLTRDARSLEKQEEYEDALALYEKAFDMWPENNKLAARLASLYLVHMGMNAKAVFYGKEALKIDENDQTSALFTAIGLANMKRNAEAKEYFDKAVSGERPDSEALISYAMFSEENGQYLEALLLLARHEDLYGDSLDTMIARARILDKEGNSEKAAAEYRAILLSGYQLPADLTRYIKGRLLMQE